MPFQVPSLTLARRMLTGLLLAVATATTVSSTVHAANPVPVRFALDWRLEGPSALFLLPEAKGYFREEGLNVTIDTGSGSSATVSRVASGTYDMGFADLAALMEFHANNPTVPDKPVAVMMVYNNMPAAVFALKKSGIETPQDLAGKKLGAPVFDAGRKAWPIFAQANGIGDVEWISMDPPLRETMLVRGDVDAITGFYFTSLLNLEARGAKPEDIVAMRYADNGVRLYGNAIIASPRFIEQNPEAVTAFLRAFAKGVGEVIGDPSAAIQFVLQRDGIINVALEERRLRLALDSSVVTPDAIAEGFGRVDASRLAMMAEQVSEAFKTENPVNIEAVWTDRLLPDAAALDVLGQ